MVSSRSRFAMKNISAYVLVALAQICGSRSRRRLDRRDEHGDDRGSPRDACGLAAGGAVVQTIKVADDFACARKVTDRVGGQRTRIARGCSQGLVIVRRIRREAMWWCWKPLERSTIPECSSEERATKSEVAKRTDRQ